MLPTSIGLAAFLLAFVPSFPLLDTLFTFAHNSARSRIAFAAQDALGFFTAEAAHNFDLCAFVALAGMACLLTDVLAARERFAAQSSA